MAIGISKKIVMVLEYFVVSRYETIFRDDKIDFGVATDHEGL